MAFFFGRNVGFDCISSYHCLSFYIVVNWLIRVLRLLYFNEDSNAVIRWEEHTSWPFAFLVYITEFDFFYTYGRLKFHAQLS